MVDEYEYSDNTSDATYNLSPPSLWERVRRWLFPTAADRAKQLDERMRLLDRAIYQYPETPTNYVLRGELYLKIGNYEAAHADFEEALALASEHIKHQDWGVVAQAMQDRALVGLRAATKHIGRS